MGTADRFDVFMAISGSFLLIVPLLAYYFLVKHTHPKLYKATLRIQVLATRTALFLPIYSLIMWLSLVVPVLYLPLQIPISIAEGYSFFCFFSMTVNNLGGADNAVSVMQQVYDTGKRPLIPCCCPEKASAFYERVMRALWYFLIVRTGTVTVQVIFLIIQHKASNPNMRDIAQIIQLIFTAFSFMLLVNGFASLVMFYELIYAQSENLFGTLKILLLKFSVGLIVIQGLIEEFLVSTGTVHVGSSARLSEAERGQMVYCFVVLLEYCLLAFGVYYAYSTDIKPSERQERHSLAQSESFAAVSGNNIEITSGSGSGQPSVDGEEKGQGFERADISIKEYWDKVLSFGDLWDQLYRSSNALTTPLTANDEEVYRPYKE